jgi:hypothetical protein
MPTTERYEREVSLPTLSDYEAVDKTRATLARGRFAAYWNHIVQAESFVRMEGAIRLGHPAVAGIADEIYSLWEKDSTNPSWGQVKQFSGSVAACMCDLNGYLRVTGGRTPLKRKVGRRHWNMGQVFTLS